MGLVSIRPRDTRLSLDVVREQLTRNPFVLKVTDRSGKEINMTLTKLAPENLDKEFANHFFYWNDTQAKTPTAISMLMVPFQFNGDE